MIERLDKILDRYNFLETELTKQEVLSDVTKTKEYSKELANLEELIACYKNYKKVLLPTDTNHYQLTQHRK